MAEESLRRFAADAQCDVVLLMGMQLNGDAVQRDLGLINFNNRLRLFDVQLDRLVHESSLQLEETTSSGGIDGGKFFVQKNVKASRKQILPIVKSVLDEFTE